METPFYKQVIQAVLMEMHKHRVGVASLFIVLIFLVLLIAYFMPKQYVTSSLLYADSTTILDPSAGEGRGRKGGVDPAALLQKSLYTRRNLERVARESGLADENTLPEALDGIVFLLRKNTVIAFEEPHFFRLIYIDSDADRSFDVHNTILHVFLTSIAESRRSASRGAYQFVDEQVKAYQRQLQDAERRLKEFNSANRDGSPAAVATRIESLRGQIESLQIQIDEQGARAASIQGQLNSEGRFLARRSQVDSLNQRMMVMQMELDTLRLSYQESYPDIVSLKAQIAELKRDIQIMEGQGETSYGLGQGDVSNPYYQELKSRLAESQVEQRSLLKRKSVLEALLTDEYSRSERVAEKGAEFTELTRDYDVTKGVYERMLERKEAARLSMTLDIEGQGLSFKIQETAVFPRKPSGLQFWHLAIVGPFLALLVPLGLLIAYVVLDPRVRFTNVLNDFLPMDVPMLAVVDHYNTPLTMRMKRSDLQAYGGLALVSLAVYIGLVVLIIGGAL